MVVWNRVETYTVNMTPRAYTLEHFRNRNLSIIISFLDHQPLLVLTSTNTCSQQLDKLLTSLVYESEVGLTAYSTILEFKTSLYTRVGCTSTTRIRRRRFFFLQVKKAKDFFVPTSYIQGYVRGSR